jgi:magnesium-transporting ATPase (P-type)
MDDQHGNVVWHSLDENELSRILETSPEGLGTPEANERLARTGPNRLKVDEGVSPFKILIRQLNSPLIYLLEGAALISFMAGHRVDVAVTAAVIILNSLLGFIQEWRAEGALAALQDLTAPLAPLGTP